MQVAQQEPSRQTCTSSKPNPQIDLPTNNRQLGKTPVPTDPEKAVPVKGSVPERPEAILDLPVKMKMDQKVQRR